ncbi:hypothetical protein F2P81_008409 [Scophthalmus maximus]|uniref:Uncharacterized protein n=1 Tax=Scophthalmus maximus TaxID=52904 RepID=A0A6A4TAK0_SCOMX|nr:hypothetical protein F2P81_008409 [Scophthalmus maximus]
MTTFRDFCHSVIVQRLCGGKTPVRTQVLFLRAPEEVVNTTLEITEEKKEHSAPAVFKCALQMNLTRFDYRLIWETSRSRFPFCKYELVRLALSVFCLLDVDRSVQRHDSVVAGAPPLGPPSELYADG